MGKFGKKHEVDLNPLHYNLGLIGLSGIGKTTVIKEMCEKLVGDEGYLFLECGREDGDDGIQGIVAEPVPDWSKFVEVMDDIVENKTTDYPNLQVVVIDTYDQLMEIAEKEVVRLNNIKFPDKRCETINGAFGGFGAGLDKAIELVQDRLWGLKEVGIHFCIIGHTKVRDIIDPVTNQTYSTLTTDMNQRYFNAIKNKLHFLGVAAIDRQIVQEKTGRKNIATKKEETINRVVNEARCITFRDDNYAIDAKSRFAEIVPRIPLDADALIKALQNAIVAEKNKKSGSKRPAEPLMTADLPTQVEEKAEQHKVERKAEDLESLRADLVAEFQTYATDPTARKLVKAYREEHGFGFTDPRIPIADLKNLLEQVKNK